MTRIEIRPLGWVLIFTALCGSLYAVGRPRPDAGETGKMPRPAVREESAASGRRAVAARPVIGAAMAAPLPSPVAGFGVVAAGDPEVAAAIPATDLDRTGALVGKEGVIVGTVTRVFVPKAGGLEILNFADDYRRAACVVVPKRHLDEIPDLKRLEGRRVVVRGPVIEYEGRPEVEVSRPSQILVVR